MIQLDARNIPRLDRHSKVLKTFDALQPGEAFEVINDHTPMRLYHNLLQERTALFEWEYLEVGPEIWRVRISKRRLKR